MSHRNGLDRFRVIFPSQRAYRQLGAQRTWPINTIKIVLPVTRMAKYNINTSRVNADLMESCQWGS